MNDHSYGSLEHELAGGNDTDNRSAFDQVFEDMSAPEYPATCDGCGLEGTNASMMGHECVESDHSGRCLCGSWDYQHEDGTGACVWTDCDCKQFISEESSLLTKEEAELVMGAIPLQALPANQSQLFSRYTFAIVTGRYKILDNRSDGPVRINQIATADGEDAARTIVRALNQHAALVEQRDRLVETLGEARQYITKHVCVLSGSDRLRKTQTEWAQKMVQLIDVALATGETEEEEGR